MRFDMNNVGADEFNNPLVSIVIPVYNAEKYLDQALFSLKYQTFPRFEVLCVDDGSTDQSIDIINRYVQSDPRFKLLKQTHQFAGVARNLGMQHAKGEYLLFLDADDYFSPNLLIEAYYQAKLFDAEICVFGANYYDERQSKMGEMPVVCNLALCPKNTIFSKGTNLENIFNFTSPAAWSKLFKRQFILDKTIEFQNTRNANDLKFVLTALAEADRIVVLDKVLVSYRINHGTSLQQTKDIDPTCIYQALYGLKAELTNRQLYEKLKQPYCTLVANHCLSNLRTLQNRKAFENLYKHLKSFLDNELHLSEVPESFIRLDNPKDKEEFFDIGRLNVVDFMSKYELFGMKRPSVKVDEKSDERIIGPEVKNGNVDNENTPMNPDISLAQKVYDYYQTNGLWLTFRKIFSKLTGY